MKYAATALVTAAICFAITATTGLASRSSSQAGFYTVGIGASVTFSSIDLFCHVNATDRDHHENGPFVYCDRYSDKTSDSAAIGISRYHIRTARPNSSYWNTIVTRAP